QRSEHELLPAVSGAEHTRRLNEVLAAAGIEVREGMLEMHGPQPAVEVPPQPVVETQGVEVGRRADLEHDVAGAACMRRTARDQVQAVLLGRMRLQEALRFELLPSERLTSGALERLEVGVVAQSEEDARTRTRLDDVVGLVLCVRAAEDRAHVVGRRMA